VAGCVGATALEYTTGVLMESLFKIRYWDYSHKKFNYKGQVCLESTLVWGFFTVVFTHYLQVPVEMLLLSIPYRVISVVTIAVTVVFSADFMLAFRTAMDIGDVLVYMEKVKGEMQRMQKRLDVIVAFKGEDVREGIGERINGISNGIGVRVDALSSSLERSFGAFRERISINPTAYVGNVRDEVAELYVKYKVMMSRIAPHPVKNFYEWYRERTIAGNPTMTSTHFAESFAEVKEMTEKAKEMTEDEDI
jgi:hypothetical protein